MRLHIISDLHVDHGGFVLSSAVDADVIIVAGDIAGGIVASADALRALRKQAGVNVPILYVPGNHDWYGADLIRDRDTALQAWFEAGVEVLDRRSIRLGGSDTLPATRFIGCTWWAAMDWTPEGLRGEPAFMECAGRAYALVADFRTIKHDGKALMPFHVRAIHADETAFLVAEIKAAQAAGETPIVISHNGVARGSCHPKYGQDLLNAYFVNDRPDLTAGVPLWIHGHTHAACDYVEPSSGCRVVCNPKGYAKENEEFNARLVVEA